MRRLVVLLLSVGFCFAQTTYRFTIKPTAAASAWTAVIPGNVLEPTMGTVTLPAGCAPTGTCPATSVVVTSVPLCFGKLDPGNVPTDWEYKKVNSFTVTDGVITNAVFASANYNSWASAVAAGHPLTYFVINTSTSEIKPDTPGGVAVGPVISGVLQILQTVNTPTRFSVWQFGRGSIGDELTGPNGWILTKGWTRLEEHRRGKNAFRHSPGNTNPLTNAGVAIIPGHYYQVKVEIFPSVGWKVKGTVSASLGGVSLGVFSPVILPTTVTSLNIVTTEAVSSAPFSVTPTPDFDGTIRVSIKEVSDQPVAFH